MALRRRRGRMFAYDGSYCTATSQTVGLVSFFYHMYVQLRARSASSTPRRRGCAPSTNLGSERRGHFAVSVDAEPLRGFARGGAHPLGERDDGLVGWRRVLRGRE